MLCVFWETKKGNPISQKTPEAETIKCYKTMLANHAPLMLSPMTWTCAAIATGRVLRAPAPDLCPTLVTLAFTPPTLPALH